MQEPWLMLKWGLLRYLPMLLLCMAGVLGSAERCSAFNQAADLSTQTAKPGLDRDTRLQEIFAGDSPKSLEELKQMEAHLQQLVKKLLPSTVGLRVRGVAGSGVIVSKDGLILTAGHVIGSPGQEISVIMPNGRRLKGITLGSNNDLDSGLAKITEKGEWPFLEMAQSSNLKPGQWCLGLGHPGGFERGRSAPLRFGRILRNTETSIRTDCLLVGGDSGGPLFNMSGQVIGIHSRITASVSGNLHIPVDRYRDQWQRLLNSETWGNRFSGGRQGTPTDPDSAFLGVKTERNSQRCVISEVVPGTPAAKAGLKVGDWLQFFGDSKISNLDHLTAALRKKKAGDGVVLIIQRDGKELHLKAQLEKRGRR